MKKILYIQSNFGLGGINRITSVKENYLVNHGFEVHNLNALDEVCLTPKGMYDEKIVMHAISVDKLNRLLSVPIVGRLFRFVYYRWQMLHIILQVNPDVIITNMPHLEPLSVIWFSFWKKRILEFHGWYNSPTIMKLPRKDWLYYKLSSLFYQIVALTKKEAQKIEELTGCYAKNIANPLFFHPAQLSTCEQKYVISLARFSPPKKLEKVIPYWKLIESRHPDWELHLYGEGPDEPKMRKAIDENHLTTVHIHSYTNDTEVIYSNASIYLLCSDHEGFPLVLSEAMSTGVPCVSYDCPFGPSEIIKSGEDGFLTEYQNPYVLIERILYLIEHDSVRKEMGRKAHENIQRFNIDDIMGQWICLFETL